MAGGKSLSSLNFILGANIKDFQTGMRKASDELKIHGKQFKKFGNEMATSVTLPIAGAVAAIGYITKQAGEYAHQLETMSSRTGLAASTLQELEYVGRITGVSIESMQKAIGYLNKSMGAADGGTEKTMDTFKRLGVNIYGADGQLRKMSDVFPQVIGALSKMENETERNALAFKIFGRGAMEIVPQLANLGESGMKELTDKARRLGLVMGDEAVKKFGLFDDELETTQLQMQAVGRALTLSIADVFTQKIFPALQNKVIPAIKNLGQWFLQLNPAIQKFILVGAGVTAMIAPVAIAIGWLSATVIPGLIIAIRGVAAAFTWMAGVIMINPVAALITVLALAATALIVFRKKSDDAAKSQYELGTAIEGVNAAVGQQIWDQLVANYEKGEDGTIKMTGSMDLLRAAISKLTKGELLSLKAFLETQYSVATADAASTTNSLLAAMGSSNAAQYATGLEIVNARLKDFKTYTDDGVEPVGDLKDEISELEKKLWDEITANDANAVSTARLLRVKLAQKKVYEDLKNTLTTDITKMKPVKLSADFQIDATQGVNANPPVSDLMPSRDDIGIVDTFSEKYSGMGNVVVDTNSVMAAGLTDLGTMIGEVFGQMIAGTATMGDFFMGIMQVVAKFIRSFGEALLAAAVGAIAFEQLLMNPYAAAAAGIALIALASVVTSVLSKGMTSGGSSGGYQQSPGGGSTDNVPHLASGAVVGKPTLALVGDNYNPIGDNPEIITPFRKLESWFHDTVLGASDGMRQNVTANTQPVLVNVTVDGQMRGDTIYFVNKKHQNRLNRIT